MEHQNHTGQRETARKTHRNYGKWFLTPVKRAIRRYNMIQAGDHIAVGVSGGKDSTALLYILWLLRNSALPKFDFHAIFLDLGWQVDTAQLESFCEIHDIPFLVQPTRIGAIAFSPAAGSNPCALCAHLRRGALNHAAGSLGCNKVALGHNLDDLLETFLLSWLYNGKFSSFLPSTSLSRSGLEVIRPLLYLPASTLSRLVKVKNLPVVSNPCPASGTSKRQEVRNLISKLSLDYPYLRDRFRTAIEAANWFEPMAGNSE